jgi:endoglucanase
MMLRNVLMCVLVLCGPIHALSCVQYRGVNIAGAEFGEGNLPGKHGKDYIHDVSQASKFAAAGFNVVRYPFRWERVQPDLASWNEVEVALLQKSVDELLKLGLTVILDPHNYARYHGKLITDINKGPEAFAAFWVRLGSLYKNNPQVLFGMMNEPYDMDTRKWLEVANAVLAALRSAGINNVVLVPGTRWTGAWTWAAKDQWGDSNANVMSAIKDPLQKKGSSPKAILIDMHQYFDTDGSGRSEECVAGAERLQAATQWLRKNKLRGFLSEFAAGYNPNCKKSIEDVLLFMDQNSDVWAGWTWWSSGVWWGAYIFAI